MGRQRRKQNTEASVEGVRQRKTEEEQLLEQSKKQSAQGDAKNIGKTYKYTRNIRSGRRSSSVTPDDATMRQQRKQNTEVSAELRRAEEEKHHEQSKKKSDQEDAKHIEKSENVYSFSKQFLKKCPPRFQKLAIHPQQTQKPVIVAAPQGSQVDLMRSETEQIAGSTTDQHPVSAVTPNTQDISINASKGLSLQRSNSQESGTDSYTENDDCLLERTPCEQEIFWECIPYEAGFDNWHSPGSSDVDCHKKLDCALLNDVKDKEHDERLYDGRHDDDDDFKRSQSRENEKKSFDFQSHPHDAHRRGKDYEEFDYSYKSRDCSTESQKNVSRDKDKGIKSRSCKYNKLSCSDLTSEIALIPPPMDNFGEIVQIGNKTQLEWRIPDFFLLAEEKEDGFSFNSPVFSFVDAFLCLVLVPKSNRFPGFMHLFFECKVQTKYIVECNFGLKKSDGCVLHLGRSIVNGSYDSVWKIIEFSELLQRRSELAPNNVLTVTCTLNHGITDATKPFVLDETKPQKLIRLDRLSKNFEDLFGDKETCDTTLEVKNKDFKVHRAVLIARSLVFAATFKHDTSERKTGIVTISDCDPDTFQKFLEYLYCGKLEVLSVSDALSLFITSDKYDVQDLRQFCVQYLMQSLTLENICEIVVFADMYNQVELFAAAQEFFIKNGFEILLTSEWQHLMKRDFRLANKLLTALSKANLKQGDRK